VTTQLAPAAGDDPGWKPDAAAPEDRLRDIQAIADAALSRLAAPTLLRELLDRVRDTLGADTAAVLLLDRGSRELVATAACGIEEEVRQGVRIPVGKGFAGRVAAERHPVMLADVDHSTVLNPILLARGIRSLLGVPLLAGGNVLGVLHVGSLRHRLFTADETALLQLAADRAALAVQSMMSQDDRMAAAALQRSLLPSALPTVPGIQMAARYVAGDGVVGGDWYDVFPLPSGELGLVIGDVAGSGLSAAVVMGRMRSALRAYALDVTDPGEVLRRLDRKIQYFEGEAMATVLYAICEPARGELWVSSAGHLPPILAAPGRPPGLTEIAVDPPIGVADDPPRRSSSIRVPAEALLCLYTDGLVERRDRPLDDGIAVLAEALGEALEQRGGQRQARAGIGGADGACSTVMSALIGSEPAVDDAAVLILRREAPDDGGR
jgi:phosphoserine phosphatase RsbU/P